MSASPINPVCWFEIPATDLALSQSFYQTILQIELTRLAMGADEMAMFPAELDRPGCSGALVCGPEAHPNASGCTIYFATSDCAEVLARVDAAGGKVLLEKTSIGEYGFIGMFLDPAGNKVGVHNLP